MCRRPAPWERVVEFHGHECSGLALGFRAAQVGLRVLAAERAGDEEMVVIAETDSCGVDAIQVLTGCTVGKGNLILRDTGKHVYTFLLREDGSGVRVAVRYEVIGRVRDDPALFEKVRAGTVTPEEQEQFRRRQRERITQILEAPEGELFAVRQARGELPPQARVFRSVQCELCGEGVMEPRAHLMDGRVVCGDCFRPYPARWR
ncbi:MAG TPA: formylmethanofuran dehydrogenase [Firmicutes bacterium]|nr:formylmethanofuran dehydrogenase [Bacillota bacterium]